MKRVKDKERENKNDTNSTMLLLLFKQVHVSNDISTSNNQHNL